MVKVETRGFATLERIPRYLQGAHGIITERLWSSLGRTSIAH